jgi:polyisoprenoid-binding protein YceI
MALLRIVPVLAACIVSVPVVLAAGAATHRIDPVHSMVFFRIQHLGVSYSYGRFNDISGTVQFDPESPAATAFDLTIKAASVDTANERRDNHLRGPDFFNAVQYPLITFKSAKVEPLGDGKLRVTGDLTLLGVTRPVTAEVDITGYRDGGPMLGYRAGFETRFTLKRSDFGMTYGIANGGAGDEVTLMVTLETIRQ